MAGKNPSHGWESWAQISALRVPGREPEQVAHLPERHCPQLCNGYNSALSRGIWGGLREIIYAKPAGRGEALDRRTWSRGGAAPPLPEQSSQEASVDTMLYSAFSKELGSCGRVWGLRAAGSGNSPKLGWALGCVGLPPTPRPVSKLFRND